MLPCVAECVAVCVALCVAVSCSVCGNELQRVEMRCSVFQQKSPVISASFAERDLQLRASYASSPPCSKLTFENCHLLLLQVFFHKRAINCRVLLRKMTCKDKASHVSCCVNLQGLRVEG